MRYSKTLLLYFLIATIVCLVTKVNGNQNPDDGKMIYELDSDGNIISYKKVKKNENGDISDDETVLSEDNDEEGDNDDEIFFDGEEDPDEDDETFLGGNFITVHMGNFIYHPSENDEYNIYDEPAMTESVEKEEKEDEKKEEIKEEELVKNGKREVEQTENKENEESKVNNEEVKGEEKEDEDDNDVDNDNDNDNDNIQLVTEYEKEEEIATEYVDDDSKIVEENVVEVEIVMDETVIVSKSKDMNDFFSRNKKMVIGCFESLGNEEYINFRNASNAIIVDPKEATDNFFNGDVLKFVNINDNQCRNTVKRYTGISMYKNDVIYCIRKRCYQYGTNDLVDISKLRKFIGEKELPLISEYVPGRNDEYKYWNLPILVYLNNDEDKTKKDISKFLGEIAEKHVDDFVVLISNEEKFDIDTLDEPKDHNVLIYAPEFQTLYSIQEILEENDPIDKTAVESFIHQYELGLVTPKLIYQDFEKVWNQDGFVINSVPRYYYPTVMNPTRDSLVIFFKSDCPYSQEFLKTFEKIGRKYANYRTKFSVVKYEAEDQKIPKMSLWRKLEAYPTVVLFKANPFSREKKLFYIYPDNAGRSAVTLDKWVQNYSFYKPKAIFNEEDYKEKEVLEEGYDDLEINEEEEEKINKYLEDSNLIFTRFGYGKEIQVVDDDDDSGEEEADFYFDNVKDDKEIPLTGTYYELVSTTYAIKTSSYTPPPSIYDDEDNDENNEDGNVE